MQSFDINQLGFRNYILHWPFYNQTFKTTTFSPVFVPVAKMIGLKHSAPNFCPHQSSVLGWWWIKVFKILQSASNLSCFCTRRDISNTSSQKILGHLHCRWWKGVKLKYDHILEILPTPILLWFSCPPLLQFGYPSCFLLLWFVSTLPIKDSCR